MTFVELISANACPVTLVLNKLIVSAAKKPDAEVVSLYVMEKATSSFAPLCRLCTVLLPAFVVPLFPKLEAVKLRSPAPSTSIVWKLELLEGSNFSTSPFWH